MLIYVHCANDPESRLPAGLLDIGVSKRQIAVIGQRTCRMLTSPQRESYCLRRASRSRFFELNSHDPQSVQQLASVGIFSPNRRKQVKKFITANDIREAHARGEQAMSVVLRASIITRKPVKWRIYWVLPSPNVMNRSR